MPDPVDRGETVLVWGGSTGVGSNAIQLARNAGYRVVSTASARNFDYLRSLGAAAVVDRNSRTAIDELVSAIGGSSLAGSLAVGAGSLPKVMRVAARVPGSKRVSSVFPEFPTRLMALGAPKGRQGERHLGRQPEGQRDRPCHLCRFPPCSARFERLPIRASGGGGWPWARGYPSRVGTLAERRFRKEARSQHLGS